MKEGLYAFQFVTDIDCGVGTVIFENGIVYGGDIGGGRYKGSFFCNPENGLTNVKMKVTIPANIMTVMGIANPYEWSFDIFFSFPSQADEHKVEIIALNRKINAVITYLQPLLSRKVA
jgi:hypothetical protein